MAKRIDEIRQKVETEGEVFVSDLSRIYNVTEETIRRDLEKLKNDGIITRTFGGAVLTQLLRMTECISLNARESTLRAKRKLLSCLLINLSV